MFQGCRRRSIALIAPILAVIACANSGKSPRENLVPTGDDSDAASAATGSSSGGPSLGDSAVPVGDSGSVGITLGDGAGGDVGACQHVDLTFLPKIPLVSVLVDRSGSIFQPINTDAGTTNEWTPLRTATLNVIQNLQASVAFGFTAYTGQAGVQCPVLSPTVPLPITLNNYAAIAGVYNALGQPAFKAETPAQESLEVVAQSLTQAAALQADAGAGAAQPGGKYILFVTDGETDFCDDPNLVCPADAVIAELQKLQGQGITTLILGIGFSPTFVPVLQSFANAGAGLPPLAPPNAGQTTPPLAQGDIYNQCNGTPGWAQLLAAAGLGMGRSLGNYSMAPTTNATVYSPDGQNVSDLTNKISAALNTVKSCAFDLQGKIKVDLTQASKGKVAVDGASLPYDATNGWTMASPTEVDLVGSACQAWRTGGKDISFDFPCEIIINLQ
jgi:hypothetical protein